MASLERPGWLPLFPQGRLQPQLSSYLLRLACWQSSEGMYGLGSQSGHMSRGFRDMGEQGQGVVEKGKLGVRISFVGVCGSVCRKPAFAGSAACRTLFFLWLSRWYKPMAAWIFFPKIKILSIYVCSLQQVWIHCSADEWVPLIVSG